MSVQKINKTAFETAVSAEKTVLVDFYADWCGPCRMMSPIIDKVAESRPDVFIGKINVDEEQELAQQFGIYSIPTLVVIKDGQVTEQTSGTKTVAQILAMLEG